MQRSARSWGRISAVFAAVLVAGALARGAAQPPAVLVTGGSHARTGTHVLAAGFTPDPLRIAVTTSGTIAADTLHLGAGCRGFVDREPDVILTWSGRATMLRLFARATTDVTLLVNDSAGHWRCNDDAVPGSNTNPVVDLYGPAPGQLDVWIGARASGERVTAQLFVTTDRSQMP
jgi:hypothetical protein